MIPLDYPRRSNFSWDCKAAMAEMCRSAIAKGIPEIGFTEHDDRHALDDCHDYLINARHPRPTGVLRDGRGL